jgi:hypothetical protein
MRISGFQYRLEGSAMEQEKGDVRQYVATAGVK